MLVEVTLSYESKVTVKVEVENEQQIRKSLEAGIKDGSIDLDSYYTDDEYCEHTGIGGLSDLVGVTDIQATADDLTIDNIQEI